MADNPISSLIQQVASDVHRIAGRAPEDAQSYANQLLLCRNMLENFEAIDAELSRITRTYHEALLKLDREQYVDEEIKALFRVLAEFAPLAEDLSKHLHARHMAYVDARSVHITSQIKDALGQ